MLDQDKGLEIALRAEHVSEATSIQGTIQELPGSVNFLEGVMHLRDDVIPVINLKKRLGLKDVEYSQEAKVAIVSLFNKRYGLLFEDIKEVFRADQNIIMPISKVLQTQDQAISALIKLEPGKRAVELLDLNQLFIDAPADSDTSPVEDRPTTSTAKATTYSRYVVFKSGNQEYGVPVEIARELTFCTEINEMFKTGVTAGAIELRGNTIPVIDTYALLTDGETNECAISDKTRILILSSEDCTAGLIVDEIREIMTIPDNEILPFPDGENENVIGMYSRPGDLNTILLNCGALISDQSDAIKSMANIGNGQTSDSEESDMTTTVTTTHHLITENCYLIFSIGQNFAIEIKDVKEILENLHIMKVPGAMGCSTEVISLRGAVVPIVNLRKFYGFEEAENESSKLIICSAHGQTVALEVDQIVTIYKQEQFHTTPSLSEKLQARKDTVNRLIEFLNEDGLKQHVLVLDIHNMIRNHLQIEGKTLQDQEVEPDEQ